METWYEQLAGIQGQLKARGVLGAVCAVQACERFHKDM